MILIIGPAFGGKRGYAKKLMDLPAFSKGKLLTEVQELPFLTSGKNVSVEQIIEIADELCREGEILTASETGSGIVPMDTDSRLKRELQGKLVLELARRADAVVRVYYGIPEGIKGAPELSGI